MIGTDPGGIRRTYDVQVLLKPRSRDDDPPGGTCPPFCSDAALAKA